jgi:hypothetical protein
MSMHLDDRTLLDVLAGEGSPRQRNHLDGCAACTARRARLARDLALVGSVLRDGPLPRPVARTAALGRWIPLAGAAMAAALLAWGLSLRPPAPAATLSLSDVSAAVFATDEVEQLTKPVRGGEMAALEAALRGEWPCDPRLERGCN